MPAGNPIEAWLKQIQKSWLLLAQGGTWLLGVIGGFLLPPPVGMAGSGDKTWLRFGQFLAAVLMGLIFFGVLKWNQKKHAKRWWLAAFLALVFGTACFFNYQRFTDAWTANYAGAKVVVGSVYTPHGRRYVEENPNLSLDSLLQDFIGRADDIWTRDSIDRRRLTLAGLYVSCLPWFTVSVVAVVQAIQCLRSAKPAPRPREVRPPRERTILGRKKSKAR
jgi:hypothetical protein